jgi:hypothetical protein
MYALQEWESKVNRYVTQLVLSPEEAANVERQLRMLGAERQLRTLLAREGERS